MNSDVLVLSGTVPVPVAGAASAADALELVDELELLDDETNCCSSRSWCCSIRH